MKMNREEYYDKKNSENDSNNSKNSNNSMNTKNTKNKKFLIAILMIVALTAGIFAGCAGEINLNAAGASGTEAGSDDKEKGGAEDVADAGITEDDDKDNADEQINKDTAEGSEGLFSEDTWVSLKDIDRDNTSDDEDTVTGKKSSTSDDEDTVSGKKDSASGKKEDAGKDASDEIPEIEDYLNDRMYNGFTIEEFASPEDIPWDQVLYVGAKINTQEMTDIESELEKIYSKDAGWDVTEYGGVDIFKTDDLKEFVKATSGLDLDEVELPKGMIYYKKWDVYVQSSATDTNEMGVEVQSVTEKDGVYTVDYISNDTPMQIRMKRNGKYWQFLSNTWNPKKDRSEAISEMYDEVLQKYFEAIENSWNADKCKKNRINDIITYYASSDCPMEEAGYLAYDLDGDGTNELLIGEITEGDKPDFIFDAYTVKRGKCCRIYDLASTAGERDRFYVAKDNTLYEEASGGASEAKIMHYSLRSEFTYTELWVEDGVKYSEDGEGGKDDPYYSYAGNGYISSNNWEQITKAEYNKYADNAEASYLDLELIPLTALEDA